MARVKDDLDGTIKEALKRDPSLMEEMEKAGRAWDIAFQIYDLRKKAELTQAQLAKLVKTSQSNIARIESADYEGYTFKTLEKVTKALKAKLEIRIIPQANSNLN